MGWIDNPFLYSQDLSNRKTILYESTAERVFLYSQDLSNRKTDRRAGVKVGGFCTLKI